VLYNVKSIMMFDTHVIAKLVHNIRMKKTLIKTQSGKRELLKEAWLPLK